MIMRSIDLADNNTIHKVGQFFKSGKCGFVRWGSQGHDRRGVYFREW